MICKKCGAKCPDGEMFCQNCGTELLSAMADEASGNESDTDDVEAGSPDIPENKSVFSKIRLKKDNKGSSDKQGTAQDSKNEIIQKPSPDKKRSSHRSMKIYLKTAGIVIVVLLIAVLVAGIASHIKASEGKRLSERVPIGRNIDYCIKETGVDFSNTENPYNLKAVSKYDYVKCSDKSVNIDGIEMPAWAVMIGVDRDKSISYVDYYDFSVLKKGWKGEYSKLLFTQDTVSYGMDKKSVSKVMNFSPYYIRRTSKDRTTWCYRYHITDNSSGTERVFNYYVVFSDTNDTVVNAYDSEIEYVNYVLGVNPRD